MQHLPAPMAIYGRLPSIEDAAISPDGSRIAYVETTADNQRTVRVVSLSGRTLESTVRAGSAKLRDIRWVDDERILLTITVTAVPLGMVGAPNEWSMLQIYDLRENKVRLLLGIEDRTMNVVFGRTMVRSVNGRTQLYVGGYYVTDRSKPGLFRIDAATGAQELMVRGSWEDRAWLVDEQGNVVAQQQYKDDDQSSVFVVRGRGLLRDATPVDDPFELADMVGFGETADSLLVSVPEGQESVWKPLSLNGGGWGEGTEKEIDHALLESRTDRVLGWVREGDEPRYGFVDPAIQARWQQVLQSFAGERVRLVSYADDWSRIVVLVEGLRDGYSYQVVDTTRNTVEPLGPVYEGLTQFFSVLPVQYPAGDGLEITAYLTLPATMPRKNLPLVVLPHGGPSSRDLLEFDWWAQALAANGYAVLQPNFRGSTGSVALFKAGFGEFGRKMQTDLSDGVRFLASKGVIDPGRVCIVGASYGGYAALAGATLDPGVYRCAVSVAGISDLSRFLRRSGSGDLDGPSQRWWGRYTGAESADDPILETISPSRHAQNVTVPVLLIHGRDDTVVPYEQTEIMAVALEDAGKPVEVVTLDAEDHWLSRGVTRLQMLEYVVGFLRAHNPPG